MTTQESAEVFAVSQVGPYTQLTLIAPGAATGFLAGQFVTVAVGGPASATVLRRPYSIAAATPSGTYAGTVTLVVAQRGVGSRWLAARRPGDLLDVIGPLGTPFPLPARPLPVLLAGAGYRAAPLVPLAQALLEAGCEVDVLLGARTAAQLFGELSMKRLAGQVRVVTDDGSAGERATIGDALPVLAAERGAQAVYAAGPRGMLAEVGRAAARDGFSAFVAAEEAMACGVGTCRTCVLPLRGQDGRDRAVRCCVEGPVVDAAAVRWDLLAS